MSMLFYYAGYYAGYYDGNNHYDHYTVNYAILCANKARLIGVTQ